MTLVRGDQTAVLGVDRSQESRVHPVSQETELPPGPVVTLSDQIQLFPLISAGVSQRQI